LQDVYKNALDVANVDIGKNIEDSLSGVLESITTINEKITDINVSGFEQKYLNLAEERETANNYQNMSRKDIIDSFDIEDNLITLHGNPYYDERDAALREALGDNLKGSADYTNDLTGELQKVVYAVDPEFAKLL